MIALRTPMARFNARSWLHRHAFTAASRVEDLAHAASSAHGFAEAAGAERDDEEMAALVEDLRAWIRRAEDYIARHGGH